MDNPFDGFTTENMKQEITRRENNARVCWNKFRKIHGNPIAENFIFQFIVITCGVLGTIFSAAALSVFFVEHSWTNSFTIAVATSTIAWCLVYWANSQEKQTAEAFFAAHPKEAHEFGFRDKTK
jgi:hypothetical protein